MSGYERAIEAAAEARRARRRPADWSLWRDMPTALVWQAVALSLDTDPDANQPIFVDCFPQDFPRRLRIAEAHVQAWSLPTIHPGPAGALYATVSLPDFATWALSLAWELPDRFPRPMLAPAAECAPAGAAGLPPATPLASAFKTPEYSKLATRDALIGAFGAFTGMDAKWFDNLKDAPKLFAARKACGQGGRGHIVKPWFCPYEVMQWLIDPKKKKGSDMSAATGWRMLKTHFPKVYADHEREDLSAD